MSLNLPGFLAGNKLEDAALTDTAANGKEFQILLSRPGDSQQYAAEIGRQVQMSPWKSKEYPQCWFQIKDTEGQIQVQIGDGKPLTETIGEARWGNGNGTVTKLFLTMRLTGRPILGRKETSISIPRILADSHLKQATFGRLRSGPAPAILRLAGLSEGCRACLQIIALHEPESLVADLEHLLQGSSRRSGERTTICLLDTRNRGDIEITVSSLSDPDSRTDAATIPAEPNQANIEVFLRMR